MDYDDPRVDQLREEGQAYLHSLLSRFASRYAETKWLQTATAEIPFVGPTARDLLLAYSISSRTRSWTESETSFRQAASQLDQQLLELIRGNRLATSDAVQRLHTLFVKDFLQEQGLSDEQVSGFFRRTESVRGLLESLCPDLSIDIAARGESVAFTVDEARLFHLADAHLLWECCCQKVGDSAGDEIRVDPRCRIHSQQEAGRVSKLFRHGLVEMTYADAVKVLWFESPFYWPPSIDAFHLFEDARHDGAFDWPCRNVLDLGCGTGFLGLLAAKMMSGNVRVTFSDWLATPLFWTALNWHVNGLGTTKATFALRLRLGTRLWEPGRVTHPFDLVLCNPPYLPIPPEMPELGLSSTVAGTDLLEEVILRARALAKPDRIYLGYSLLAADEVADLCRASNIHPPTPIAEPRLVPFRVPKALERPDYIDWLVDSRGLEHHPGEPFEYWHQVCTFRL